MASGIRSDTDNVSGASRRWRSSCSPVAARRARALRWEQARGRPRRRRHRPRRPPLRAELERPPPVTVRFSDESVALQAWAYCFDGVCIDGSPPAESADVGNPEEVVVEFPLPGWSFTASFRPAGDGVRAGAGGAARGRRRRAARLAARRPRGRLRRHAPRPRRRRSRATTFRWTTPGDGVAPTPRARLAVLAGDDGAGRQLRSRAGADEPGPDAAARLGDDHGRGRGRGRGHLRRNAVPPPLPSGGHGLLGWAGRERPRRCRSRRGSLHVQGRGHLGSSPLRGRTPPGRPTRSPATSPRWHWTSLRAYPHSGSARSSPGDSGSRR